MRGRGLPIEVFVGEVIGGSVGFGIGPYLDNSIWRFIAPIVLMLLLMAVGGGLAWRRDSRHTEGG